MKAPIKSAVSDVRALIVDDNPLIRDLMRRGLEPLCQVTAATDGADALLQAVEAPPDLIIADFRMRGLDGRELYQKLHARESTRNVPFIFVASRSDIEDKLRPLIAGEDFLPKPFFVADLVRLAKKIVDRLHLEKMQRRSARPGVIQGRLEEMGVTELMQSLDMGQKSCRLTIRNGQQRGELYFVSGQCRDARLGDFEGDPAVYQIIAWSEGDFEIDFNASSDRVNTTRSTTGLLMEAMRLMDEAHSEHVGH